MGSRERLLFFAYRVELEHVRRARHGAHRAAGEDDLVALLDEPGRPGGAYRFVVALLDATTLLAVYGVDAPHHREHAYGRLLGADGQYLVRRSEAGHPQAREPALGRGDDRLEVEVLGELARGVRQGVVAVPPAPFGGGEDVSPVVYGFFGRPADAVHLLHALQRVAPDGRLAREHHRVGPVEDGVRDVGDLGAGGPGVPDHGVEHLRGDDDGFAQATAAGDDPLLLYGHPLGREFDGEVAARHHDAVGGFENVLYVVYGLVLLNFGDHRHAPTELLHALLDLHDLVPGADERDRDPIRPQLFDAEAEILEVLRRQATDGERRVREVQALVRGNRSTRHHDAVNLAVLDLVYPELQKTVVYEDPVAGLDILDYLLIGGREPAGVAQEVPRRYRHPVSLYQLRPADYLAGPYLRPLQILHHRHVAPQRFCRFTHEAGVLLVPLVFAVAKVQACHVHPETYEVFDSLLRRGAGTQSRDYLRPALHPLPPPPSRVEGRPSRVVRRTPEHILYAQQLVVLRDALAAGRGPSLYLPGVHSHREVRDRRVFGLAAAVANHGRVPRFVREVYGLERLRERADLIDLDENGVPHPLVYAPREDLRVGHEQVVPDELHPLPELPRQQRPRLPVVLRDAVLDAQDRVLVHEPHVVLYHLLARQTLPFARQLVGAVLVKLRGSRVQGEPD